MRQVAIAIISRPSSDGTAEYLLVSSRKDFGTFTAFYYPPGGHVEMGETIEDALIREVKEEVGLLVRPIEEVDVTPGDVPGQETHWWKCEFTHGELAINKEELFDASYFSYAQMKNISLWPATKNFFDKYSNNQSDGL